MLLKMCNVEFNIDLDFKKKKRIIFDKNKGWESIKKYN